MYDRDLTTQLRAWKDKGNRKPLVLRGARQVGKTTLVDGFSREFDHYIKLNLEKRADREIFSRTDQAREIVRYLFLRNGIVQDSREKTLIFIDEIQESAAATSLLRYFYEDTPEVYVIAAGSRLQKLMKASGRKDDDGVRSHSFPVGRVEYLSLRPFSFLEFLSASGKQAWRDAIETLDVSGLLHDDVMAAFNTYALIGGMPEVVSHYIDNGDVVALSGIFDSLVTGYCDDAEYYARNEAQSRIIRHILNSGWQAAGKAITFSRFGNSEYTSTQVHEAMNLLCKAFILSLDYPVTSTRLPAIAALNRSPKLVWMDNGIVNYKVGIQHEYLENRNLLDTWRGGAAEHVVAQELRVLLDRKRQEEQFFWIRDKKGASSELDFLWQYNGMLVPVEVKSGHNARLQSLHVFVDNSEDTVTAVRVWNGPLSVNDLRSAGQGRPFRLINVPFYYVCMLEQILGRFMLRGETVWNPDGKGHVAP